MFSIRRNSFLAVVVLFFVPFAFGVNCPAGDPCLDLNTQAKGSRMPFYGTDSGAANAYAITTMGVIGSGNVLQTGSRFYFIATHANTTASTLAVNGGSAKAIKKNVSSALVSGDILLNGLVEVVYDGTNFQMLGPGTTNISLPLSVANGGTGLGTLTAHAALLGEGTSNVAFAPVVGTGNCLMDNGLSSDPTFQTCGGGSSATTIQSNSLKGNTVTTGSIVAGNLIVVGIDSGNSSVDPPVLSSSRVPSWTLAVKSVANANKAWLFYGIATSSGTDSISSTVNCNFCGTSYLEISHANAIVDPGTANAVYSNVAGISSVFSTTFLNDSVVSFWSGAHVGECVTAISPMVTQSSNCAAPADPLAIGSFFAAAAGSQTAAFNSTGGLDSDQVMLTAAFTSSNSALGVAPFYQTVEEAGTDKPQELKLNFDADLNAVDDSANNATKAHLKSQGLGTGSCGDTTHSCGINYNDKGIITGVSNNTISGVGSSSGLALVEQHTASSSAELDFTSCISSTYDQYEIKAVNLVPATNGANVRLEVSTDGGSTYDTGANYTWEALFAYSGGTGETTDTTAALTWAAVVSSTASNGGVIGSILLSSPQSTSAIKQIEEEVTFFANNTGTLVHYSAWGSYNVTGSGVNAFRIKASSGNLASGTVRCYGLVK